MQSLWSRAGQAHRCGCRVCDVAVSTLSRRVTTAATRPRKPTFTEIFTACYSTMFASAAVVDAIRKEDQRRELDSQLEDARRELAELQIVRAMEAKRIAANVDAGQPELTLDQMNALWDSLKEVCASRPFLKEINKPVTLSVSELLARLHDEHYHNPDPATMQALRQTDYERIELAIQEEELDTNIHRREPQTQEQLHRDSRTVVQLVRQLLKRAELKDKSSHPCPSVTEAYTLASRHTQSFTFASIDPPQARKSTYLLNRQLREIINSPSLGLKEIVGRVCYNILVSAYPPDMHTYNTLIVGFDKLGHKSLAESLVNSYFHKRRIYPTPSTFVAFVNHYKDSSNALEFLRMIACITGIDTQTGAKIGRRLRIDIEQLEASPEWARGEGMTPAGDWVNKNVPLDQPLIEAILNGLLDFRMFDQAVTFFLSCMNASVSVNTSVVRRLFDECILALDWRAAVHLVRGFTHGQNIVPSMLGRGDEKAYLVSRLRVLVDICGLSRSGQTVSKSALANLDIPSTKFGQFMKALAEADGTSALNTDSSNSTLAQSELDQAASSSRSRLLQIESMLRELRYVERETCGVESKLLYPNFSLEFRTSMAFFLGECRIQHSIELEQDCADAFSQMKQARQPKEERGKRRKLEDEEVKECERFRDPMGIWAGWFNPTPRGLPTRLPAQDERPLQLVQNFLIGLWRGAK
ncbi:hypothetical protein BKA56DRAFT_587690 [Ilyonectria sp. MPI-CAGE-AT-0026]|nr:hypothetical protein BKA56DRAFT_587690 [Ilyonectria sp. MPI-CAGE-AT-0026]